MWRTDCSAIAVVARASTASRGLTRRVMVTISASESSITAKGTTVASWKSGECHSRISDCCAGDPWVSKG